MLVEDLAMSKYFCNFVRKIGWGNNKIIDN